MTGAPPAQPPAWAGDVDDTSYRLLVDSVRDYAIFLLDPDGCVRSWNRGAERIKGYAAADVIGRHFSLFYPAERIAEGWPDHELAQARATGRFEDEGWRVRQDGSRFWANVVISRVDHPDGRLAGFAKVTRDLTAHRRVRALEDEGKRLTTFLAMLGHELRNPLAPIANAVAVMGGLPIESEPLRHCRAVIQRQVAQMTRLVDDLLDVSRITSGKVRLQRETLDLRAALADALETVEADARRRAQSLTACTPDAPAWVRGDRARLVQVLSNLPNNAVKFTPAGGTVMATVRSEPGVVEVTVRDDGPGIPPEKLADIFNPFVQGEQGAARSLGGLGLGLSLVQQLVTLHDGEVSVSSSGQPGEGAEFRIRLPATAAPGAPAPADAPLRTPTAPRRLLIVDDNRDAADTLQLLLEALGYTCATAYDGTAGLQAARATAYDAVILDLGLPDLDGLDVARRLRTECVPPPRLIAVTGYAQAQDLAATRGLGFDAHLAKPVAGETIAAVLERLLATPVATAREA